MFYALVWGGVGIAFGILEVSQCTIECNYVLDCMSMVDCPVNAVFQISSDFLVFESHDYIVK